MINTAVERNGGPCISKILTLQTSRWIPWKVDTRYAIYDKETHRWSDELYLSLQKCKNAIIQLEWYYNQKKEKQE